MTQRGKRFARLTMAVGLLVLAVGVYVLRDQLLQPWYMNQLRSEDVAKRRAAAENLASMMSVKAIPQLLRTMSEHATEFGARRLPKSTYFPVAYPRADESAVASFQAVCSIVDSVGKESLPAFRQILAESTAGANPAVPGALDKQLELHVTMMCLTILGEQATTLRPAIRQFIDLHYGEADLPWVTDMTRASAVVALWHMNPGDDATLHFVEARLSDSRESVVVRCAAADVLGSVTFCDRSAAAALEAALHDESSEVRAIARKALERLRDSQVIAR